MNKIGAKGDATRERFPYHLLLAYCRDEIADRQQRARIAELVESDTRWKAHWESIRHLDLETAAAIQDGKDLRRVPGGKVGDLCALVAETDGRVFDALIRGAEEAAGRKRPEWDEETKQCVYCRRMRRRAYAKAERERAGLPDGEPLLREWLLESYYNDALREATEWCRPSTRPSPEDVAQLPAPLEISPIPLAGEESTPHGEEPTATSAEIWARHHAEFLRCIGDVAPLLLDAANVDQQHLEAFREYLHGRALSAEAGQEAPAPEQVDRWITDFCQQRRLLGRPATQGCLHPMVLDNILWQMAAARVRETAEAAALAVLDDVQSRLADELSKCVALRSTKDLPDPNKTVLSATSKGGEKDLAESVHVRLWQQFNLLDS